MKRLIPSVRHWALGSLMLLWGVSHAQAWTGDVSADAFDMFVRSQLGQAAESLVLAGSGLLGMRYVRRRFIDARWRTRMGNTWLGIAAGERRRSFQLTADDTQDFQQLINVMCHAWVARDVAKLKSITTGDLGVELERRLAALASLDFTNKVTEFKVLRLKMVETWSESSREFATMAVRLQLIDATYDGNGDLREGSAQLQQVNEMWTFNRRPREIWRISAINRP